MRITSMELAGRIEEGQKLPRAFARIRRNPGDEYIEVVVLLPTGENRHIVDPTCEDDLWSMAKCLQETLDGCRGTRGDTMDYFRALQHFTD